VVHRDSFFIDRRIAALIISLVAFAALAVPAFAAVNDITPSTNDINRTNGWAHVNQVDERFGETDLELVSTREFLSCFEYRSDGDTSQSTGQNPNPAVTDGFYPYLCISNTTAALTVEANSYVEVRMVFGGESDERFDWTRFEVIPDASSKDDCSDGTWADFGFANQGQCNRFVNGGGDSRL
jgi:type V secretory pathway adhesin AidA